MSDELFRAFDECLNAVEAGASLENALARYPHLAAELRPMLQAAQAARPTEILRVPKQSEEASRRRFLVRAQELKQQRTRALAWWPPLSLGLRFAIVLLALVFGGWGVTAASASALPGELLYPIKRVIEQAQVSLAVDTLRPQLEAEFNQRRLAEIQALLEQRREAEVEFTGLIEQANGEQWVIARLPIRVPTALQAGLNVNDEVTVHARTQTDGALQALSLRLLRQANIEAPATPTLAVTPATLTPTPTLDASATAEATTPMTATPSPSRTASPTITHTATPTFILPTPTPPPSNTDAGNNHNDNDDDENGNDDGDDNDNDNDNEDDEDNDNDNDGSGSSPSHTLSDKQISHFRGRGKHLQLRV